MPSCVGLPQTEEAESARLSAPAAKDRTPRVAPPDFAGPASIAARAPLKSGSDHRADDGQTGKTVL